MVGLNFKGVGGEGERDGVHTYNLHSQKENHKFQASLGYTWRSCLKGEETSTF